jgi:bacteriocin biosynthesis cyclodehydratase domain-containing protein
MIYQLDPGRPLLWRTPQSVQLGVDPPVAVLEGVTAVQERMLAALAVGVSDSGLRMLARGADDEREQLLRAVAPALSPRTQAPPAPTVAITGHDELGRAIAGLLAGSDMRVAIAADPRDLPDAVPDVAVLAAHFVVDPAVHGHWLRRDVPHLPVVLSDTGALIGPMVEPGAGPCLLCLELHRRDADEAWPAVATQLLGRRSRAHRPVLVAEAAAAAARMLLRRLAEGSGAADSVRIDGVDGERAIRSWERHPECGCAGIDALVSPARPGSDWADAARRAHRRPSSAPSAVAPG